MNIVKVSPRADYILQVEASDGRIGTFDVSPYLKYEAFSDLKNQNEFSRLSNGGYFIEWDCGADLSADTIEAKWTTIPNNTNRVEASTSQG